MYGLDLFSGIGGIAIALQEWVKPVAYCEIDSYARAVLISRMSEGELANAPIWDDVRTLRGGDLPKIDIIYGGFPCQDISVAGRGKGLEGERSGLFFEIMRLADETKPKFIFLENVPNIRTKGLERVVRELTNRGYDSRWCTLSASEVGANHQRKRWFLLAYASGERWERFQQSNTNAKKSIKEKRQPKRCIDSIESFYAKTFPKDIRKDDGLPYRVDRVKCLGNAVVPIQAQEAFKILAGLV